MSNATDTEERIRQGFVELLERLRAESVEDPSKKIRSNTEARERAQNRVWREYSAIGLLPPSDLALSVTARRELGIGVMIEDQRASECA